MDETTLRLVPRAVGKGWAVACALWLAAVPAMATAQSRDFAFELPNLEGGTTSLAQYRGRPVVVDFWAVWCKSCRKVFPILNELREQYGPDQVGVVGISLDGRPGEYVAEWAQKAGLNYTLLHDRAGKAADRFGVEGLPTLFIFDPEGNLVYKQVGVDSGEKETIFSLVKKWIPDSSASGSGLPNAAGGSQDSQSR